MSDWVERRVAYLRNSGRAHLIVEEVERGLMPRRALDGAAADRRARKRRERNKRFFRQLRRQEQLKGAERC